MPALDSGWLAESGSIPGNCTMVELRTLCSAMLARVQKMERIARQRGIDLHTDSNEDNEAAFPFVDPATLDIHNSDAPEISSPTGSFAGKANRTEDADRPSTINYPPLPAKPRAAKISDETFSNGPALIEHIDAGEMLRVGGNLTTTIDDINTTLQRLDFVFVEKGRAEEIIRKGKAATKIASHMRKVIVSKKYHRTRDSLRSWKRRHGGQRLVHLFEEHITRSRIVEKGVKDMAFQRSLRIQAEHFKAFARLVDFLRPTRMAQLDGVVSMRNRHDERLLRFVTLPWKNVALGPRSRKAIRIAYEERVKAAKASLRAVQESRHESKRIAVTTAMIEQEVRIKAEGIIRKNRTLFLLKRVFRSWSIDFLRHLAAAKEKAHFHWASKMKPRIFYAWVKIAEARDEGVGVNKSWTKQQFDTNTVNMRAIAAHAEHLCIKHAFRALRDHVRRIYEVKRRYLQSQKNKLRVVMADWLLRAQRQRKIKRLCVKAWKNYGERADGYHFVLGMSGQENGCGRGRWKMPS